MENIIVGKTDLEKSECKIGVSLSVLGYSDFVNYVMFLLDLTDSCLANLQDGHQSRVEKVPISNNLTCTSAR